MDEKRSVDSMCIGIEKVGETSEAAEYSFVSDVYAADPGRKGRSMVVGQTRGTLRIIKATGEISLVQPMPEDDGDKRYQRAATKVRQHWTTGQYPDKTMFACG